MTKKTAKIDAPDNDSVRLAVVADTHSQPHPKTAERLAELKPDAILHGGDIGDLAVLDALTEVAPVHAVRGNIDVRARDLPDELTVQLGPLRVLLTHIAVAGVKLRADAARAASRCRSSSASSSCAPARSRCTT